MGINRNIKKGYGLTALLDIFPLPIVSDRAPVSGKDAGLAGLVWIDQTNSNFYIMANEADKTWVSTGGGAGVFDSLTVTNLATIGDGLTVNSGTTTIVSHDNAPDSIYLHADGGVNETIRLHSDQGVGRDSINLVSDVGGVTVSAAAGDGLTLTNGVQTAQILIGAGSPNGIVTGLRGSLFIDVTGSAATILFVNSDGLQTWTALS